MHEVYKALYNCAPPDVVFCIDQSASMYRPAYATKDLQCDDSFGTSRTQESTPETIAATGKFHGYRTCRTNHPSHTTGTYTCPDPTGAYGNHGVSI